MSAPPSVPPELSSAEPRPQEPSPESAHPAPEKLGPATSGSVKPNSDVSLLLNRWSRGEAEALPELMPLIMEDLRGIARRHMTVEDPGHTLDPTALVNELYLKLAGRRTVSWQNRAQFFAFVAGSMRRLLVDHARGRKTHKRGGEVVRISLDPSMRVPEPDRDPDLLALDQALTDLAALDERQARIVELRYFTGLTVEEVAEVEKISPTTVKREWRTARLWLMREIRSILKR
ncbi:MAG: sigma-70 family RNA polymerase sigma factor [Acidobacteriota bacterium]